MKKALFGVVIVIVALVMCLTTTATFMGEGLVGYLLIELAVIAGVAYYLPALYAPKTAGIILRVEMALGIIFILGGIGFAVVAGLSNVMTQRIFAWLLLSGLTLLCIGKYGRH